MILAIGLFEGFLVLVAIVALLAVLNFRSLKRVFGAAQVQAGKVGRWAENADPMGRFREQIDNHVEQIAKGRKGLERSAGLVRSVERQVDDGQRDKERLESLIRTAMAKGDPNKTAADYARQLARVEAELKANTEQLASHRQSYNDFKQVIENESRKMEEAHREANALGVQLAQSETEKEFLAYATDLRNNRPDGSKMAEARRAVQERIDQNRGAGDVARDLARQSAAEAADEEMVRQAEAEAILDRFRQPANGK